MIIMKFRKEIMKVSLYMGTVKRLKKRQLHLLVNNDVGPLAIPSRRDMATAELAKSTAKADT